MATPPDGALLGRLAVHTKLISMDQLEEATREQGRLGGTPRLGDIFVEKGWITQAQLQKLVALQRQVLARHRAARATEHAAPVVERSKPEETPRREPAPRPSPPPATQIGDDVEALFRAAADAHASDLHVHSGAPLRLRRNGRFVAWEDAPIASDQAAGAVLSLLTPEQRERFEAAGEIDFAYTLAGVGRFRANVYRQQRGIDGVFRRIAPEPPSLEELELPQSLARLVNFHQGMVLLTGPAGCGKSSTLAALLNLINEERREHVVTIEDPIECVHPSKRCIVNQRQVGPHTESFARALRAALREDPDVIAIGELRDLETVSLALTAAETGHFVLATLHTNSATRTINRLVGSFPPDQQGQVRTMLSESLRAVVSQRLVSTTEGERRVPALEILVVNNAVGNLIRENKTFQIHSILQTGSAQGMCLLDASLAELVRNGTVSRDEALRHCDDPKRIPG